VKALVTGASGGIGLEIARVLAPDHDLVLVARSAEKLNELAAELGGAQVVAADLATQEGVAAVTAAVPDAEILVNNAGVGDFGPFAEADPEKTDRMIRLNITALTDLTRHYLPPMVSNGHGRVLNVASTASFQPGPLMAVYYATKAYVLSFSEALSEETRGTGVTVTALCPGPTASGFQAAADMELSPLVANRKLPTSAEVAQFGVKAMMNGDAVAIPGLMNRVMAESVRFTPRFVIRRLVHKMQATKPGAS
jgi:short-subunit dehydrogenase